MKTTLIPISYKSEAFKEMAVKTLSTIAKRSTEKNQFGAFGYSCGC